MLECILKCYPEVTLAITAKIALGTEIVVSVVAGALDFEVGAMGVVLFPEADASVVGLELAGDSDVEGVT